MRLFKYHPDQCVTFKAAVLPLVCLLVVAVLSACGPTLVVGAGASAAKVASQERTVGNALDDMSLETAIEHKLFRQDFDNLFAKVDVDVIERRAFLTGNIASPELAIKAVQLAWEVQGIREVVNELQLDGGGSFQSRANDIWIQAQINSRLMVTKGIQSVNYNVEAVDGVVYLMGIAQDEVELQNVANIAARTQGVKEVVSHVVLKNDPRRQPYEG